ncbi:class I SAM-dependent methyltransferase [Uliginosibacterium aquaticum]|uniref:SAM-dependent methyltransferase n=1 Tax=Uliginosibacterium aquaticum TaxID=2731212 RepID=A0ABX2IHD4_9RHOO|nr:SAM-dependent methyltransferase [Uliginosibacterium aquaticum]NSL56174.1 SAM-dependent methyltransferase [Uliginosibacterium aquaticum]
MHNQLPTPGADALEHSARLSARIAIEIRDAGGWLGFARFMELALFAPGLGYYSGGSRKFGPDGDFVTAPEISPLFGRALAAQVLQVMEASAPELIEVGAGTGALACDLLLELEARGCLPAQYGILELSGELRVRQAEAIQARVPHLAGRVVWLDALPENFSGCVLANEVLDVMPVQLVVWRDGAIFERGVVLDAAGEFAWQDRPAAGRLLAAAKALPVAMPEEGEYLSEICLAAQAWVAEWASRIERGALLLIDYGYPQAEYYLPSRSSGSLQCYYRHRAHPEVLLWPGLNDITSFVDFTAIATAAHDAGFSVAGYTSQASFLQNCGLLELLGSVGPSDSPAYLRAARAALRLVAPHEMGELFKVLLLTRGLDEAWLGVLRGDRTHAL